MLTTADVAGFDLPSLAVRLQAAAVHSDRCRRQPERIKIPHDALNTRLSAMEMDKHAEAVAEGARFVALASRLFADEASGRPAAPVLRLVPQTEPPAPKPVGRLTRVFAALWPAREVA